jgi:uncharacterized protein
MIPFSQNEPLTDAELDRLGDVLKNCKGGRAMNVETLDGFFAALIAGPEAVMPSEYYPEVFGGEISDTCEFDSLDEANEFLGLMMRHWNDIAGTLFRDEVYVPLLIEDKEGIPQGNDWAHGFMLGVGMRNDGWAELINNEDYGGSLLPMMVLFHEHDQDPEMRPDPFGPEKREEIIDMMAGGCWGPIDFFVRVKNLYGHHIRDEATAQLLQNGAKRSMSLRLRKEVQTVLLWDNNHQLNFSWRTHTLSQKRSPHSWNGSCIDGDSESASSGERISELSQSPVRAKIRPVSSKSRRISGCIFARNFSLRVLYGLTSATFRTTAARLATREFSDFVIVFKRATFFSEMWDCCMNANMVSVSSMACRSLFGLALHRLQI